MLIGLTPGHLFVQWNKALRPSGFTKDVQSLHPTAARAQQRSFEADLNDVHSLRQANASRPDSPAVPLVLSAALCIRLALRLSKMIGLGTLWSPAKSDLGEGGVCLPGCPELCVPHH